MRSYLLLLLLPLLGCDSGDNKAEAPEEPSVPGVETPAAGVEPIDAEAVGGAPLAPPAPAVLPGTSAGEAPATPTPTPPAPPTGTPAPAAGGNDNDGGSAGASTTGSGKAADGAACLASDDCQSGICEGEGCDAATPGKCMTNERMCTRDLRPYCGCDGQTFRTSGSCPGKRFARRGPCETAGN